jgi:hypothetical protein
MCSSPAVIYVCFCRNYKEMSAGVQGVKQHIGFSYSHLPADKRKAPVFLQGLVEIARQST